MPERIFTAERIPLFRLLRKVRMKSRFSKYFPRALPAQNIRMGFFTLLVLCSLEVAMTFPLIFGFTREISKLCFVLLNINFFVKPN